jgi:hypothetical protein
MEPRRQPLPGREVAAGAVTRALRARPQAQFALYESASGFALFEVKEQDAIGTTGDAVQQSAR